ncbi:TIGR02281 family clan AA aspartic protease [Devosia sp.]|jgi:aspartyl protease family protein|uniref:TIGR02281 family clan AA aspartic protease n=1 Tax=Devosia sp. TaxID=1871048 RepID=UPI0037BFD68F
MLFVGFALLISVGIALLISADAGSLFGLTQQQTGQLAPLLIILVMMASALATRRVKLSQMFTNLILWIGIFGTFAVGYAYRDDLQNVAARVFSELVPGEAQVDSANGTARFRVGRDGHYQIATTINGTQITTTFDTGASAVVLSDADARTIGIDMASLRYNVPVATANGTGRAAQVMLDRMEVGGIVRNRIRAFVAERGALDQSLLGMSFLRTLSRYSVSGNTLELSD